MAADPASTAGEEEASFLIHGFLLLRGLSLVLVLT